MLSSQIGDSTHSLTDRLGRYSAFTIDFSNTTIFRGHIRRYQRSASLSLDIQTRPFANRHIQKKSHLATVSPSDRGQQAENLKL